jgi:hypothetical protein
MSDTPSITARVSQAAIHFVTSTYGFSVMQILAEANLKQRPSTYPLITVRQAQHALDEMTRQGQLVKRAAGRFVWRQ